MPLIRLGGCAAWCVLLLSNEVLLYEQGYGLSKEDGSFSLIYVVIFIDSCTNCNNHAITFSKKTQNFEIVISHSCHSGVADGP